MILSTPTGSGKSLVAVAAHFVALAQGRRTFYTAPLKALVSEKFFALVEAFGSANVGMMTGDSAVNPRRPDHLLHGRDPGELALRERPDDAPTSARSSWTSSTSTPTRSAAGRGRCRCWSCRAPSSC